MITENSTGRYLFISVLGFVTYLFLGSFIVSKNFLDLAYLITFYVFMIAIKIIDRK